MGIRSQFRSSLASQYPEAFTDRDLAFYQGKKIAIDIMGIIFRYKIAQSKSSMDYIQWLDMVKIYILNLVKNGIFPIIVFEGEPPEAKLEEIVCRREKREKIKFTIDTLEEVVQDVRLNNRTSCALEDAYSSLKKPKRVTAAAYAHIIEDKTIIEVESNEDLWYKVDQVENHIKSLKRQTISVTSDDIQDVKIICESLGVFFFDALGEAEQTCAWLCINGHVAGVMSDDSDLIPLLCPIILSKNQGSRVSELNLETLIKLLDFSKEQLTDWAIMCGTDYNENIPKIGYSKSKKLIQDYGSIDNLKIDTSILKHKVAREMFGMTKLDNSEHLKQIVDKLDNIKHVEQCNIIKNAWC